MADVEQRAEAEAQKKGLSGDERRRYVGGVFHRIAQAHQRATTPGKGARHLRRKYVAYKAPNIDSHSPGFWKAWGRSIDDWLYANTDDPKTKQAIELRREIAELEERARSKTTSPDERHRLKMHIGHLRFQMKKALYG